MMDVVVKTLEIAYRDGIPVKIIYEGKDGITQRVIVIKNIKDEGIVAYCRLRRRISTFKPEHILAAELIVADR